jgi:hypothetical protein
MMEVFPAPITTEGMIRAATPALQAAVETTMEITMEITMETTMEITTSVMMTSSPPQQRTPCL